MQILNGPNPMQRRSTQTRPYIYVLTAASIEKFLIILFISPALPLSCRRHSALEGVHVPVPDSATFVCVDVAPEHSDDGRVDCRWERLRRERRHTLIKRQQTICTHLLSTADEL